ncbi:MAG TPA: FAD binding domain-containing protein [Anaerolineales bacterium]
MPLWNNYHLANSITDALRALQEAPASARLIAGGTDLLLDLQQGRHPPVDTLVDVTCIPDLTALELRGESLYVGASVPLNQIVRSPLANAHAQALVEACALIGGPQVRNMATLGGNVAHALPAADGTIALLALDARVEVASAQGSKFDALENLFLGPGKSALDQRREIIVGFYLPLLQSGQASAFVRIMRPQGVALPILNFAVWLQRESDCLKDIRLALGPSGPRPVRARETENLLRGRSLDDALMIGSLEALLAESRLRTSPYRASEAYRREIAGVLLEDGYRTAWERAGQRSMLSQI